MSLACLNKIKQHNQEDINHDITMKHLLQAIEIFDIVVGADHPDTAELCMKVALAYKEAKLTVLRIIYNLLKDGRKRHFRGFKEHFVHSTVYSDPMMK